MNEFVDSYNHLIQKFSPRIIKNEVDYLRVQDEMDRLIDSGELSEDEQDYLSLLGLLVEQYDRDYPPFPELRGAALVKALIEQLGLKQKDLTPIFKTQSITSATLNGHRSFTVQQIDLLSRYFQLPHSLFFESETTSTIETPFEKVDHDVMTKVSTSLSEQVTEKACA